MPILDFQFAIAFLKITIWHFEALEVKNSLTLLFNLMIILPNYLHPEAKIVN